MGMANGEHVERRTITIERVKFRQRVVLSKQRVASQMMQNFLDPRGVGGHAREREAWTRPPSRTQKKMSLILERCDEPLAGGGPPAARGALRGLGPVPSGPV